MRKLLLALGIALLAAQTYAATPMFRGPGLAITGCTNATPIVCTSAAHGMVTDDQVYISGVQGNLAANGAFRCHVVAATTCSLQSQSSTGAWADVAGSGAYTAGGTLQVLGITGTTTGASSQWYECSKCIKASVLVWVNGAWDATIVIEGTANPIASFAEKDGVGLYGVPSSPAQVIRTLTQLDAVYGWISIPVNADWVRGNITAHNTGTVYSVLTCERAAGDRVH